jgi:Kef-type K+ transport system membrane component KefB
MPATWMNSLLGDAITGRSPEGTSPFDRLYLAVASSLSSTLIVVKLLSDKFELSTFAGRVTPGVLVLRQVRNDDAFEG